MEKIVWIISSDRQSLLEIQRSVNETGGMRALCMMTMDIIKSTIAKLYSQEDVKITSPSLIMLDYDTDVAKDAILYFENTSNIENIAGVPLYFLVSKESEELEQQCYNQGAIGVLVKPFKSIMLKRIERVAWQYNITKSYERSLQKQASEIEAAKSILELNKQLENRNNFLKLAFGKYFPDDVIEEILESPMGAQIGGKRRHLAVLISDLRGFTSLSEDMTTEAMTDYLDYYFERMIDEIIRFKGTIIEFLGDGILAIFGDNNTDMLYCESAIAAAINMQNRMAEVNEYGRQKGYAELNMGIGVHCGEVFVGNVGSNTMMRYNVIGRTVNECSRIESYSVGGQVLASDELINCLSSKVFSPNKITILAKGLNKRMVMHDINGLYWNDGYFLNDSQEEPLKNARKGDTVQLYLVDNKIIESHFLKARLIQISLKSAKLSITGDIPADLFLQNFSISCYNANNEEVFADVYGKVIEVTDDIVSIRFTHVNHDLNRYVNSI